MTSPAQQISPPSSAVAERIRLSDAEVDELALAFQDKAPQEVLAWAIDRFGDRCAIGTSLQVDGMAILDMAWRINPQVRVFTIDTGRLPTETYDLMETVRQKYDIAIEVYFPDAGEVEALVRQHGVNLFRHAVSWRLLCCNIRKVRPLRRALCHLDAWATGLRRDQWATRANIRKVELAHDYGGIVKVNPLADWTEEMVWDYIGAHSVPVHPLYEQGYATIGCAPCTRPISPGEPKRSGRWWWETDAAKECGIHWAVERRATRTLRADQAGLVSCCRLPAQ